MVMHFGIGCHYFYKMREEYSKLGKSLFVFYAVRTIAIALIFYAGFAYINDFYTHYYHAFPDYRQNQPFMNLENTLTLASQTAKSIYSACQLTISEGYSVGGGNYCPTGQIPSECRAFLMGSMDNQLIYNTYGIYTSFQCQTGDCVQLANMWDYFWTFRIRLKFINYIVVEYNHSGSNERLVAPAYYTETGSFDFSNQTDSWALMQNQGVLALSYLNNEGQTSVRVILVLDSTELTNNQDISLGDYDFPSQQSSDSSYLTYSIEGVTLFGFSPVPSFFVDVDWFFNFLVFLAFVSSTGLLLYLIGRVIEQWQQSLFGEMQSLDNLYQNQINSIFQGEKPKKSAVLSISSFTHFYEDLAEVVDKDCEPLLNAPTIPEKEETFKFTELIDRVMGKFEDSLKPLEQERGRQFSNLKPLIRSSIAEISESVERKLRDLFLKSRELGLTAQFFHFGYLAVLQPTAVYEQLLKEQRTALPDAVVALFRYMNHTINSGDLKFAFKFAFAYHHLIEQQIIMRLQDQLLPKYLDALRNLDVMEPTFRHRLKFGKRLVDLEVIIENKRHISAVYLK